MKESINVRLNEKLPRSFLVGPAIIEQVIMGLWKQKVGSHYFKEEENPGFSKFNFTF